MSYENYQEQIDFLKQQKNQRTVEDPDYALRQAKASLFFDDQTMLEFLAAERFPDDPLAAYRYEMIDGDIFYRDDDNNLQREFERPEDAGVLDEYLYPNIAPATTVVADMAGAIKGGQKGFEQGVKAAQKSPFKHPAALAGIVLGSTALGGATGAGLTGAAARGARGLLIDQFYNLPPEEQLAAAKDLGLSVAFSAFPFGQGPVRNLFKKFKGREEALKYLVNLRAGVQGTIDEAAKMGFKLTPAEAADVGTGALGVQLQYFLSRQPQIVKIQQMYGSRAQKTREAINAFADSIGSTASKTFGSPAERVAAAAREAIKELTRRREERAGRLYQTVRENPDQVEVDTSGVIAKLDNIISDPARPQTLRSAAEEFKETLMIRTVDEEGEDVLRPLTNLMQIHDRRTSDMESIVKSNLGTSIAGDVIKFREEVTELLDEADPLYNLARRVYDPTKPNLQATERSAIGRMSRIFEGADKSVAKSIKEIFDPDISVRSMRNAKRVLKAQDPEVWQDVKKFFINDKLDQFTRLQTVEEGVPSFQRYFSTPKNRAMMQELMEPEEFETFDKMLGFMDMAFNRVPRGGSQTQPLTVLDDILASEASGISDDAKKILLTAIRSGPRVFTGNIGDEYLRRLSQKQREAYYDKLVNVLLDDPNPNELFDEAFAVLNGEKFRKALGAMRLRGQAGLRAGEAAVEEYQEQTSGQQGYEPTPEDLNRMMRELEEMQNPQSSIDMPIFEDLPTTPAPPMGDQSLLGPTVLPRAADREIAARRSGIAGLV
jgi:hypothetical protein